MPRTKPLNLTLEETDQVTTFRGVNVRAWETTIRGRRCKVLVSGFICEEKDAAVVQHELSFLQEGREIPIDDLFSG